MSKEEYLSQLRKNLSKLPKEEFQKAIEYFEEYLTEAGDENLAQAMEDLGTPQEAADQVIREFATDQTNREEAKKNVRKGFSGVWIVILAIFASPIAMPLIIAIVAILFAILAVVISLIFALGLTGVALAITAPLALAGAISMLPYSVPVVLVCLGICLITLALGTMIIYGSYLLVRKFLYWIMVSFGKVFVKGGKKNEEK
ncbi:MAG TPA: DUF1700 domain-containing protein [Lachnospiraceae bacterium]|nr:DUF1700 domain-containing protein [Lachnospiraceae bacterium]HPF29356.1 DUF1700 domain-containing protein [Lachnospiraceae bacterium]